MSLPRLTTITVGVPDVDATAAYYGDFGLSDLGRNCFVTADAGRQLRSSIRRNGSCFSLASECTTVTTSTDSDHKLEGRMSPTAG
jgi:hypothetical protein